MEVLVKYTRLGFVLAFLLALNGCGYDDFKDYDPPMPEMVMPNMDIGDLKNLYDGTPKTVYDDVVVAGYVTANDKSGNLYRTFMVEDATGAIEVKAGLDELHNIFPVGMYVAVKAQGLRIGAYNDVVEIGLHPDDGSFYDTDYFGHKAVMDMYVVASGVQTPVQPSVFRINELDARLCGTLVRVNNVRFSPDTEDVSRYVPNIGRTSETWATPRSPLGESAKTGYRIFRDKEGNTLTVVTSGYANFAGEEIPSGTVSLTGILSFGNTDKGKKSFLLKLRDLSDVGFP